MTLSRQPLSATLPGTWQLLSRIDVTATGERRPEPSLGEDPVALLIYDRGGHFAAQFMRRDRSVDVPDPRLFSYGLQRRRRRSSPFVQRSSPFFRRSSPRRPV